ncbi:O-antigen ligase family protein [Thermomonas sp.]|uniref:O-antigen ligase family protein n=1 Tax=Thermomonas sp. TaxID=1971895 RepID=UPI00248A62D2|nr:O-antigen ligase family protein [Thermomonas sp.]MDI1253528.1 O-antigen ligase family protein [Thermomonas sp.]
MSNPSLAGDTAPGILVRMLVPALLVLLVASWCFGGVVEDSTSQDEWLQLLALPVLALAVIALSASPPSDRLLRAGLLLALLIALVPAIQLLPLPNALWSIAPGRAGVAADLARAGIVQPAHHWSLTPHASERAVWALLPALAAFLAACALPVRFARFFAKACVAIVLLNVLFALFESGLPRDSGLRMYPDETSGFGGLLINPNHFATALVIGLCLSIGLAVDAWRRAGGALTFGMQWVYAGAGLLCMLAIPITTSRAGIVLVPPALVGTFLLTGVLPISRIGKSRGVTIAAAFAMVLGLIGVWSGFGWLAVAKQEDPRMVIADATFRIGKSYFPLGSGIGSFQPVFEQHMPASLWMPEYVNHAHNEYAQWWLTGGLPAMLVLAFGLIVFALAGIRIFNAKGRSSGIVVAAACWVGIAAALVHSWVDFPLSTTTLMTTTAMLAGFMLSATAEVGERARRKYGRRPGMENG